MCHRFTYGDEMSVIFSWSNGYPRPGMFAHLTPNKNKTKQKDGNFTNQSKQGYCAICKSKYIYSCSQYVKNISKIFGFVTPILVYYALPPT